MRAAFLGAGVGGGLLAAAFPPLNLDVLAWVAFIPFLWSIERAKAPIEAALYGCAFGTVFFFLDVRWIYGTLTTHGHFPAAPAVALLVGMVLVLSIGPAAFAWLTAVFARAGWRPTFTAPFTWTAIEYVRATVLGGFPWDLTGYAAADRLALAQVADITGVYGLSFLILLVNAALWEALRRWSIRDRLPWRLAAVALIAVGTTVLYGNMRLANFPAEPGGDNFRVGVLQANIPQEFKWTEEAREYTFGSYEKLAAAAAGEGARLLVWPETSVPVLFGPTSPGWKRPGAISERLKVPMLVGAPSEIVSDDRSRYYNSAFLVDGKSLRYRYDKIHLVPFGEYMPLSWLLPIGPGIAAREEDYSPGESMTVMHVDGCPAFSVLICYEAIFPELSRLASNNGAAMLINITNDGWFGATAAPYQHLRMARMRSIESRVPLVRCANTGVSAAFDAAGRMSHLIPLNTAGYFVVDVPRHPNGKSLYSRWGDLFVWGCVAAVMFIGALTIRQSSTFSRR